MNFYDDADLRFFSNQRKEYINFIDNFIVENSNGSRILDIGSGDGIRIKNIGDRIFGKITVIENNIHMCKKCKDLGIDVFCEDIESFVLPYKFDTITCLWSVLGYVKNPDAAIKNIAKMLSRDGILFIDINIRYNLLEYGFWNCLRNLIKNCFFKGASTNYFSVKGSDCFVYLFSYSELDNIFKKNGLKYKKVYINYKTGKRTIPFLGQLLYVVKRIK